VGRVEECVLPPAEPVQDAITHGEAAGGGVIAHGDDDADRAPVHRLVQLEGRDVGLHVVHPAAHVRVDRQMQVAYEDLTGAGLGDGNLRERWQLFGKPVDTRKEFGPPAK
jgi:hypothetical protein